VDPFDARYDSADEIQRDGNSVLYRAVDRHDGATWLVRRLVHSHRQEKLDLAGLQAEADYTANLNCPRCPEAEAITLEDGELLLEYRGGPGVELDRVLSALEASGRVLEAPAAVALVSEVLHNAETISMMRPPAVKSTVWGHGEISPKSVLLGRDGFGRLYETRLVSSGFRSVSSVPADMCRAPELIGNTAFGTPAGDVFSVGAIMAHTLLGTQTFASAHGESLVGVIVRRVADSPALIPAALYEVLLKAVAEAPDDRFVGPSELRDALRTAMPLDLDGWRGIAEGLAELARTLGSDRRLSRVPDTVFLTYPKLARPIGGKRPSLDDALVSFATEKALSHVEIDDALMPIGSGDMAPRGMLPKRIPVVPRRNSTSRSWPPPEHSIVPLAGREQEAQTPATINTVSAPPAPPEPAPPPEPSPPPEPAPPPLAPQLAKRPTLEIIPSEPAPPRPTLEIIPSNPAPPEPRVVAPEPKVALQSPVAGPKPAVTPKPAIAPEAKLAPAPMIPPPRPSGAAIAVIVFAFIALVVWMIATESARLHP